MEQPNQQLLSTTDDSNMLPIINKGKCSGCKQTAKDNDVLLCCKCKNHFHAVNCTVTSTLESDALPSNTNLTAFSKFSKKTYPTGSFSWTCFRCTCVGQVSSESNLEQRVSFLETLLISVSPALKSLAKVFDNTSQSDLNDIISKARHHSQITNLSPSTNHSSRSAFIFIFD